jgi:hypothetical protein
MLLCTDAHWPYSGISTQTIKNIYFCEEITQERARKYSPNHCPCTGCRRAPIPAPIEAKTKEKQLLMVMP